MRNPPISTQALTGILFGSSAFQILNAFCEFRLAELLHDRPGASREEIGQALDLRPRPVSMLLLGTTALGLTVRSGAGYHNGDLIDDLVRQGSWEVMRDIVAFEAHIVHLANADFVESLRQDTNVGLHRFPGTGDDLYHRLAADPELERLFYRCMGSWSKLSNPILVAKADLTGVHRVLDVGGGDGVNAIALANANPHVRFTVVDLPGAVAIARKKIAEHGLTERIDARELDIFADPYPTGHDCVLFANQLLIWSPDRILRLLGKAYEALDPGGRVLVFSAMSDDRADGPLYAALDNVYFATIPAGGSMIYAWGEYERWLTEAGFGNVVRLPGDSWTPHGAISATKRSTVSCGQMDGAE
jgi:ubiquinone/menaquinone biosynthesis C-methylase UbiE